MHPALFYIFAAVMLIFGILVVALRNPVASALSLVVSFLGLAALFVSLNAYFIGVIQVLVYAGAVMVLFLFIIMLLDLKANPRGKTNALAVVGGIILVLAFSIQLVGVISGFEPGQAKLDDRPIDFKTALALRPELPAGTTDPVATNLAKEILPDVNLVGETIFSRYNFHLQIIAVLLLVATVGVVVLSKKDLK
ncbi:MAG: NADH-quinone oxidoreductase subunit J [Verrucomicrobiales bacterium]|nr:NADH-quinone oxidoreductase subunit J [Verrucomicrobiales bacterium]